MRSIALPLALIAFTATSAAAQDEQRYQLERTEDGYVRLDTRTGELTRCQENGTELICRPARDQRAEPRDEAREAEKRDQIELELDTGDDNAPEDSATADEIERLQAAVEALEERIEALEAAKPVAVLPTEQELERSIDYAERFLRRFMGIVKELDEKRPDSSGEPSPDRT